MPVLDGQPFFSDVVQSKILYAVHYNPRPAASCARFALPGLVSTCRRRFADYNTTHTYSEENTTLTAYSGRRILRA